MSYVFDSSSLIYMGKLNILEKVGKLEGKKFIPRNVYKEVVIKGFERREPEAPYINKLIKNKTFIVRSAVPENISFLSEADREVLALARITKSVAIIDETYAKSVAKSYGIKCHGTVHILLKLMEKRSITKKDAINYIDKMVQSGFYLSAGNYKEIMNIIKKY